MNSPKRLNGYSSINIDMQIEFVNSPAHLPDTRIIPLAADEKGALHAERLSEAYGLSKIPWDRAFSAEKDSVLPVFTPSGETLVLLGLGSGPDFATSLHAFRTLSHKYPKQLQTRLGIDLRFLSDEVPREVLVEAACNGLALGTYRIGAYKAEEEGQEHPLSDPEAVLSFFGVESVPGALLAAGRRGLSVAATQKRVFSLVNAPGNKKRPADLADWAKESGREHGFKVTVMGRKKIRETGLHALLAVNQGSEDDPAFIIMEYEPHDLPDGPIPSVGLVGKGVTFDTGGLSIKSAQNMHLMKSDMGGAAAVLGTLEAVARLQLPVRLIGIVPSTDNCVDARSVKPGDIIDSYSGKTIEVIDTDAEGRLILADGLAYMQKNFAPEVLIDLATLTGSAVRALGYHAAALFSDNDKLAEALLKAGERCGERSWRLPLWEEYGEDLKADMADLRNLGKRPMAGAIFAAKFLEVFTDDHPAWAHFDIAGVAFRQIGFSREHSATAWGVRLLTEFLQNYPFKN